MRALDSKCDSVTAYTVQQKLGPKIGSDFCTACRRHYGTEKTQHRKYTFRLGRDYAHAS